MGWRRSNHRRAVTAVRARFGRVGKKTPNRHGAAMNHSSVDSASSRKAGRGVEAGGRRPAAATTAPAPGFAGERVARRAVERRRPRRIGRACLAKYIGRILIVGPGMVSPRLGKHWRGGDLGIGADRRRPGRQWRASPDFRVNIDQDRSRSIRAGRLEIARNRARCADQSWVAPPASRAAADSTGRRDAWPPERRQCGVSCRAACHIS